jgi:hypothetical protein
MIYPLLPTSIFGVLWYQGEQNTFEPTIYGYVLLNLFVLNLIPLFQMPRNRTDYGLAR